MKSTFSSRAALCAVLLFFILTSCDATKRSATLPSSEQLIHMVTFKLKPDLNPAEVQAFVDGIRSLCSIPYLSDCLTATPAETGDARLVSDYDLLLQMSFRNMELLERYSKDEFHLAVRKNIKSYLAEAPVVYDFWASK